PEAAPLLHAFHTFAQETPMGRLEEVYTGFFDLNPVCHPYVGYQLFGESYKRSSFLLQLKDMYRAEGFQFSESELPDRLSVMLRFLAHSRDGESVEEIMVEGLQPALARMTKQPEASTTPLPNQQTGEGDMQLEGQSQGEVLAGGFVLALTEESEGADTSEMGQHPYQQALLALHMVLEQLYPTQTREESSVSPGGGNHG
ncbi:MAG: molecular chaperone TorD family protein, partial [Chloroflexi bacterium]|nr:molecular chaperone TorD family protein [Chloroflexota bacterium]